MAVLESLHHMIENSGILGLLELMPAWMALDLRQLIFLIATPIFIGVTVWEYQRIRHDDRLMNVPEAIRNFFLGAGYQTTELFFAGLIAFPVFAFAFHFRLFELELTWFTALATFIAVDFCYYWFHRTSHRVRWFWSAHVVHHSSKRMNFSTAMRQNATNIFNGGWLFYVPLAVMGLNPIWIGVAYALSLVYQFFIHTTVVNKLHPAIEYVFNTPSHHRVHHGKNRGYIDRNYAGVLMIWDRMFGTFTPEIDKDAIEYGITTPVPGNDLITLWTHEYRDMFKAMAEPGPIGQRLQHLWRPPEWQRPTQRQTHKDKM